MLDNYTFYGGAHMRKVIGICSVTVLAVYILFCLFIYAEFTTIPLNLPVAVFNPAHETHQNIYSTQQESLWNFVKRHILIDGGGIRTNTISTDKKGGDTLSESVGLMMDYSIRTGNRDLFDKEFSFLERNLLTQDNFIKWKTADPEVNCNAAIDDLRIVAALIDAYGIWSDKRYIDTAGFIQYGIYKNQVKDGNLYELYDWKSKSSRKSIPLCYIDLYAADRATLFNEGWRDVENNGEYIIKNGRINGSSPFFYKYYKYDSGTYSMDEEFENENGICLTYTLYTVLHLAEMNYDTEFFTNWLKAEMKKGKLYSWYNPYTLKPSKEMESTAVYALAAIYSRRVGEEDLYDALISRMMHFMVTDKNSRYHGGFGDKTKGEFYSFDNLMAMCALAVGK